MIPESNTSAFIIDRFEQHENVCTNLNFASPSKVRTDHFNYKENYDDPNQSQPYSPSYFVGYEQNDPNFEKSEDIDFGKINQLQTQHTKQNEELQHSMDPSSFKTTIRPEKFGPTAATTLSNEQQSQQAPPEQSNHSTSFQERKSLDTSILSEINKPQFIPIVIEGFDKDKLSEVQNLRQHVSYLKSLASYQEKINQNDSIEHLQCYDSNSNDKKWPQNNNGFENLEVEEEKIDFDGLNEEPFSQNSGLQEITPSRKIEINQTDIDSQLEIMVEQGLTRISGFNKLAKGTPKKLYIYQFKFIAALIFIKCWNIFRIFLGNSWTCAPFGQLQKNFAQTSAIIEQFQTQKSLVSIKTMHALLEFLQRDTIKIRELHSKLKDPNQYKKFVESQWFPKRLNEPHRHHLCEIGIILHQEFLDLIENGVSGQEAFIKKEEIGKVSKLGSYTLKESPQKLRKTVTNSKEFNMLQPQTSQKEESLIMNSDNAFVFDDHFGKFLSLTENSFNFGKLLNKSEMEDQQITS